MTAKVLVTISLFFAPILCVADDVTSTWDGSTSNWSSSHWSSANFPNNGNDGANYDAVIGAGSVTVDQNIAIQSLALSGSSTVAGSTPFDLTINETLDWTSGSMTGTGQTIVASGGSLILHPATFNAVLSRRLANNGAASWIGTRSIIVSGGTFQNNGSLTASTDSDADFSGSRTGPNIFNNAGTFTKQASTTNSFSSVSFNNSGTVDVRAGTLALNGGGTHTGDFTGLAGATLKFSGVHTLAAGADLTGDLERRHIFSPHRVGSNDNQQRLDHLVL